VRIKVKEAITKTVTFPKGSFVIQTGQVMGRVVAHMLEPETNDNIFRWNTMDYAISTRFWSGGGRGGFRRGVVQDTADREPPKRAYPELPMYKLIRPMALPTVVVY
jgi:hypothetical protein